VGRRKSGKGGNRGLKYIYYGERRPIRKKGETGPSSGQGICISPVERRSAQSAIPQKFGRGRGSTAPQKKRGQKKLATQRVLERNRKPGPSGEGGGILLGRDNSDYLAQQEAKSASSICNEEHIAQREGGKTQHPAKSSPKKRVVSLRAQGGGKRWPRAYKGNSFLWKEKEGITATIEIGGGQAGTSRWKRGVKRKRGAAREGFLHPHLPATNVTFFRFHLKKVVVEEGGGSSASRYRVRRRKGERDAEEEEVPELNSILSRERRCLGNRAAGKLGKPNGRNTRTTELKLRKGKGRTMRRRGGGSSSGGGLLFQVLCFKVKTNHHFIWGGWVSGLKRKNPPRGKLFNH